MTISPEIEHAVRVGVMTARGCRDAPGYVCTVPSAPCTCRDKIKKALARLDPPKPVKVFLISDDQTRIALVGAPELGWAKSGFKPIASAYITPGQWAEPSDKP